MFVSMVVLRKIRNYSRCKMLIRIDNELSLGEMEQFKQSMDDFFATDFHMVMDGSHVFLSDK